MDILRGKGIEVTPALQNLVIRLESVRYPLSHTIDGRPQLVLHPRCKMLRKGFGGKYQYKRVQVTGSAERYKDEPDKNEYSHPHDALQYVATKVFGDYVRGRMSEQESDARADAALKRFNAKLPAVRVA